MVHDVLAQGAQPSMSKKLVRLAYLMNNSIWVVKLDQAAARLGVESKWSLPNEENRKTYAGLTCAQQEKLGAHVSIISGDAKRPLRTEIVTLDLKTKTVAPIKYESAANLLWPLWSPNGQFIAATVHSGDLDSAVVVELATGRVRLLSSERSVSPHSWQAGSARILATSIDSSGKQWETVSIDLESGSISPLLKGGRPISSVSLPPKIAVVSGDLDGLTIYEGKRSVRLKGEFRELIQWVDESTILAIVSIGSRNRLAIVNTQNGITRSFDTSEFGEINGVCVLGHEGNLSESKGLGPNNE